MNQIDLSGSPIIAAVKNEQQLQRALESDCETVFLLFGDILSIAGYAQAVRDTGKNAIVHLDLINGLSAKEIAVDFIARTTCACGIISTKPMLVRRAKELGLFSVLRVFVIDSRAFDNISRDLSAVQPDVLEILPGILPGVIARLSGTVTTPIIAGGLISQKKDILDALEAGALAVSTTDETLWDI